MKKKNNDISELQQKNKKIYKDKRKKNNDISEIQTTTKTRLYKDTREEKTRSANDTRHRK